MCFIHRSMYVPFKTFNCGMFELSGGGWVSFRCDGVSMGDGGWVSFRCDEVGMGEWVNHICGSGSGSGCGFVW